MTDLSVRLNEPFDLAPLAALLTDAADLARVNPSAKHPFDPLEWQEKWLNEPEDVSYYLVDSQDREVGFFALRVGIGPEVRHLTYAFVAPEARGGAGGQLAAEVEAAAVSLQALSITLKVDLDNAPALNAYLSAGFEELGRSGEVATMRKDLD